MKMAEGLTMKLTLLMLCIASVRTLFFSDKCNYMAGLSIANSNYVFAVK